MTRGSPPESESEAGCSSSTAGEANEKARLPKDKDKNLSSGLGGLFDMNFERSSVVPGPGFEEETRAPPVSPVSSSPPPPSDPADTLMEGVTVPLSDFPLDDSLEETQGLEEEGDTTSGSDSTAPPPPVTDMPEAALDRLEESLNRSRWVVPVLPKQELDQLLGAAIALAHNGLDKGNELFTRFIEKGFLTSFQRLMTDDAVKDWKPEIQEPDYCECKNLKSTAFHLSYHICFQRLIYKASEKGLQLIAIKLADPEINPVLLDVLAMIFDQRNRFHTHNSVYVNQQVDQNESLEEGLFAKPPTSMYSRKKWLVELINHFGRLGGFQRVLQRFSTPESLDVSAAVALQYLRPFVMCYSQLRPSAIEEYLLPLIMVAVARVDGMTDADIKAEEGRAEGVLVELSMCARALLDRLPPERFADVAQRMELFRLKLSLRILHISAFASRIRALDDLTGVLLSVTNTVEQRTQLTKEQVAKWLRDHDLIAVILRDNLHHAVYVERVEKLIRQLNRHSALTDEELDRLWSAQSGKHDIIQRNLHECIARLAWEFNGEQLVHMFNCFKTSWRRADSRERQLLLDLLRRLSEEDKECTLSPQALKLLWDLATDSALAVETVELALGCHLKILESCAHGERRDRLRTEWLHKCIEQLPGESGFVVPAIKHLENIFSLYPDPPMNQTQQSTRYRRDVVSRVQQDSRLCIRVSESVERYMIMVRSAARPAADVDVGAHSFDGRYAHSEHLASRLSFMRFLLSEGNFWLSDLQALQLWDSLIPGAAYPYDREVGFAFFAQLMQSDDLDPDSVDPFFESRVLQVEPALLSDAGLRCFVHFFKAVNKKRGSFIEQRRGGGVFLHGLDLVGHEYLWKIILAASEAVSVSATTLFRDIYANPSPEMLMSHAAEIHSLIIDECINRLRGSYDTLKLLGAEKDSVNKMREHAVRIVRVLKALCSYVRAFEDEFGTDSQRPPLHRAALGRSFIVRVRHPGALRPGADEQTIELYTHTNELLGCLRRQIVARVSAIVTTRTGSPEAALGRVELFAGANRLLDPSIDDRRTLMELHIDEDTPLQLKLGGVATVASSPDTSADSSPTRSPNHERLGANEMEALLPSVWLGAKDDVLSFLFDLVDLGSRLNLPHVRDNAFHLFVLLPFDLASGELRRLVAARQPPRQLYFSNSPSRVLYWLRVTTAVLLPGAEQQSTELLAAQTSFVQSQGLDICLSMLTQNNFLHEADADVRLRASYYSLRLLKFHLMVLGRLFSSMRQAAPPPPPPPPTVAAGATPPAAPSSVVSRPTRALAAVVDAVPAAHDALARAIADTAARALQAVAARLLPTARTEHAHIDALLRAAVNSACGGGCQESAGADPSLQPNRAATAELVACEALDALALAVALCPTVEQYFARENLWRSFVLGTLFCENALVRSRANDTIVVICRALFVQHIPLVTTTLEILFETLHSTAEVEIASGKESFQVICRLLEFARLHSTPVESLRLGERLSKELKWLQQAKEFTASQLEPYPRDGLLIGHLNVTKELVLFLSAAQKLQLDQEWAGDAFLADLINEFLLPSSRAFADERVARSAVHIQRSATMAADISARSPADPAADASPFAKASTDAADGGAGTPGIPRSMTTCISSNRCVAVCGSGASMDAGYGVVVALCKGCLPHLAALIHALNDMFYKHPLSILEWEYAPQVALRGPGSYVGLKNGGATCYMNSVFQQLFAVDEVRDAVLRANGALLGEMADGDEIPVSEPPEGATAGEKRIHYNQALLRCVQLIFANLLGSQLQFYVPKSFWLHFRFGDHPVNLREQQDALEFLNALVDAVDEGLKAIGGPTVCTNVFGGSFADQKNCRGCPHKYVRNEPFTSISVDVRSHNNLLDSLRHYVKADLLEGDNAYYCESCNKKVDAEKRLCIGKLPPLLAIQLKRFDYDYERDVPVKFQDNFEFPRDLDMEPYTADGLARREGTATETEGETAARYRLRGVIVHSGQAAGGHYYSYIRCQSKWYKFDDGDVTPFDLDNDDELRAQCFGGDYCHENFDHITKRYKQRTTRRWWNAYILFYERALPATSEIAAVAPLSTRFDAMSLSSRLRDLPGHLEAAVRRHNTTFSHERNQYMPEFFRFMQSLASAQVAVSKAHEMPPESLDRLMLSSLQLLSNFLFATGLRAKKALRGNAQDWTQLLTSFFNYGAVCRVWFVNEVLFAHTSRFAEYLLESTSGEIRSAFGKILLALMQTSANDSASLIHIPADLRVEGESVSDLLIRTLLLLPEQASLDFGRHPNQYFGMFYAFAQQGPSEKEQLLRAGALASLTKLIYDETILLRSIYAETTKCFQTIGLLARSSQMDAFRRPAVGDLLCANPFGVEEKPLATVLHTVMHQLSSPKFLRSLLDQAPLTEDTRLFLQFCCWENMDFSRELYSACVWQIVYSYMEAKTFLALLRQFMLLEDSWAQTRILYFLKGDPATQMTGLFTVFQENRNRLQKKCYLLVKMLTRFFEDSTVGKTVLDSSKDLKTAWIEMIKWLNSAIDRPQLSTSGYKNYYYPTAESNEILTGPLLERTASATDLLVRVRAIAASFVEDESTTDEDILNDNVESPPVGVNRSQAGGDAAWRGDGDGGDATRSPIFSPTTADEDADDYPRDFGRPPPPGHPPPPYTAAAATSPLRQSQSASAGLDAYQQTEQQQAEGQEAPLPGHPPPVSKTDSSLSGGAKEEVVFGPAPRAVPTAADLTE